MNDEAPSDSELLCEYRRGSEPAFRELVRRRLGLVHATARRVLAIAPHLADDVAQNVFTDLAKMAATLPAEVVLAGWLYRHSYFLALNAARAERRRRHAHERIAMESNALHEDSKPEVAWARLAPLLDNALNQLDPVDRNAIVLRFLQHQDLREVGRALGASDDAAQKRVARALEKLRSLLTRGGIAVSSTALLASTLEASPAAALPHGLVGTISTQALSHAAANAGWSLFTLKTMTISKYGLGLAAALLIGVGIGATIISRNKSATANTSATTSGPVATAVSPAPAVPPQASAEAPASPGDPIASDTPAPSASQIPAEGVKDVTGASKLKGLPGGYSIHVKNGIATITATINGVTQTQTMPAADLPPGLVPSSSPAPQGEPISSTLEADGSTTIVYAVPGSTTRTTVNISADGTKRTTSVKRARPPGAGGTTPGQ